MSRLKSGKFVANTEAEWSLSMRDESATATPYWATASFCINGQEVCAVEAFIEHQQGADGGYYNVVKLRAKKSGEDDAQAATNR